MSEVEQIARTLGFPVVDLPAVAAHSMESAIRFMVERLVLDGSLRVGSADAIVSSVLKRESLGSTALGGTVAMPHSISSTADRVLGILAHSPSPVPWDSPDGQPVETICLIIAPLDRPGDYMQTLEKVAWAMKRKQR